MVTDLIPHLEMFKKNTDTVGVGEDQAEEDRRSELSRYARRSRSIPRASPHRWPPQRIATYRKSIASIAGKEHRSSAVGQGKGFQRGGKTHQWTSRGYQSLSSEQQLDRCVRYGDSHEGTDIATTSNLPPSYQSHCKGSRNASILYVDDRSFTQSSFDTLLKLHEVVQYPEGIVAPADA